jgi:spermidine/putrescine transport system ATP-binding protein
MQIELQNLQRDVGITFLLVTHDQEEALSMSDRVCIMRDGRIVQTGSPRQLYDRPVNRYVADFVGKSNFFAGKAGRSVGGLTEITLVDGRKTQGQGAPGSAAIVLSIRPEQLQLAKSEAALDTPFKLTGQVLNRIFLGEHTEYLIRNPALGDFMAVSPRQAERDGASYEIGDRIAAGWRPEAALVLDDS